MLRLKAGCRGPFEFARLDESEGLVTGLTLNPAVRLAILPGLVKGAPQSKLSAFSTLGAFIGSQILRLWPRRQIDRQPPPSSFLMK